MSFLFSRLIKSPCSRKPLLNSTILLLLLFSLSGCTALEAWFSNGEEVRLSAPNLASKGMREFSQGNYYKARKYFDEILDYYPFSPEAMLAELKGADSNYFMEYYQEALILYHEFEERHPTNEAIPYVMYQIAMCHYQQIDRIDRDTTGAEMAIKEFSKLLRAFPDSPYTTEARARIRAANEFLVNHEYFVVEFYLRTEKYSEAKTRLRYLLSTYPDATIVPKAKEMLQQLEAGESPKFHLSSWLKNTFLPDWTLFTSDEENGDPPATMN